MTKVSTSNITSQDDLCQNTLDRIKYTSKRSSVFSNLE